MRFLLKITWINWFNKKLTTHGHLYRITTAIFIMDKSTLHRYWNVEDICFVIGSVCCPDCYLCQSRSQRCWFKPRHSDSHHCYLVSHMGYRLCIGHLQEVKSVSRYTWVFLVLSGISTGLSWLFYFKAIQIGDVSRVAPVDKLSVVLTIILAFILLKEPVSPKVIAGGILICAGSILMMWK